MRIMRRRRREGKTDYKARLTMLKSDKPRIVIRKTNRYVIIQLVKSDIAQDKVISGISSKNLLAFGWPKEKIGSLKSLPAAYLAGFLLGEQIKEKTKHAIFDIGMNRNVHQSRIYAVLKGLLDSGISIPHNKEALPSDEILKKSEESKKLIDSLKKKITGGK